MVIRENFGCRTCGAKYTVRVGVGTDRHEMHSFDCLECGLPISIITKSDPPKAWVVPDENAVMNDESQSGIIINLHPNFAFEREEVHQEYIFASLAYLTKIADVIKKVPGNHQDAAFQFDMPNANFMWGIAKGVIILKRSGGQEKKIQKLINDYERQRRKIFPDTHITDYKELLYNFFDSLFYPKFEKLLAPSKKLLSEVKEKYPEQFQALSKYHRDNLQQENINRYISIFADYFKIRTDLNQMIVHSRLDDIDIQNKVVGSKHFDVVKLFYGQAFETLTSHFPILACINNILSNRDFDQFQQMTLNKYIKDVEKAKMSNPFSDREELFAYAKYLDSTLRNGSHHASMWREGEIIYYRSGGSGEKREMPYSMYLYLCNELIIAIAALFCLELELNSL